MFFHSRSYFYKCTSIEDITPIKYVLQRIIDVTSIDVIPLNFLLPIFIRKIDQQYFQPIFTSFCFSLLAEGHCHTRICLGCLILPQFAPTCSSYAGHRLSARRFLSWMLLFDCNFRFRSSIASCHSLPASRNHVLFLHSILHSFQHLYTKEKHVHPTQNTDFFLISFHKTQYPIRQTKNKSIQFSFIFCEEKIYLLSV